MIPILFDSTETAFTTNGIGRLIDATRCEVTEERNGKYELYMKYPIQGTLFNEIKCGRYIFATHDESKIPQAFQIYEITAPLEGIVDIRAWHISYALNTIVCAPYTASSCLQAMSLITTNSINPNPFIFWTDKDVAGDFHLDVPRTVRSLLGGSDGSILDRYGKGEYEFDMFNVKLHLNRGADRGVSIRYGKNLTELEQTLDASDIFNSVVPYWTDYESIVYSTNVITRTGDTAKQTIPLDLSEFFYEAPTVEELDTLAQVYVDAIDNYKLKENLEIDFIPLWQTEEYKNFADLERVFLCDTVHIYYERLGINATAKCIRVVYDTLGERYTKMELGEPRTSLTQEITNVVAKEITANVPTKTAMDEAIERATELITGGFGGYIKYHYLSDGTPSELLIMNHPDESEATHIIRMNQNGIGFSTDGGSTYGTAWTINGNFNADYITAGTLNASLMTAGMIQDATGANFWNLTSGEFQIGGYVTDSEAQEYAGSAQTAAQEYADNAVNQYSTSVKQYMNYNQSTGELILGKTGSNFKAILTNQQLSFTGSDGQNAAWINNNQLYIKEAVIPSPSEGGIGVQLKGSSGRWLQQVKDNHFQIRWVTN